MLNVTAAHRIYIRRGILVLAALYFFYSGELLTPFCFFSGALLADLSLVLKAKTSNNNRSHNNPSLRLQSQRLVAEKWPFALAMFAVLLGTVPPENQDFMAYSRVIYFFFVDYITTEGGITLPEFLIFNRR